MTAHDAVELCRLVRPRTAIPIHYEGWKHFRQGRDAVEREFAKAPEDVRRSIRWRRSVSRSTSAWNNRAPTVVYTGERSNSL
jgi:L-ascorbate metabolism protein UlaG (beta-lactamase superfamily)